MARIRILLLAILAVIAATAAVRAEVKVVASIKPIHSIVAAVMAGTGTPTLILEGAASPHTASLKPSQAQAIADADVIFWVGHNMESFLEKPIETVGAHALVVTLEEARGVDLLPNRDLDVVEEEGGEHHDHGAFDPHIWLDPQNAAAMADAVADALAGRDAANADRYRANAEAVKAKLAALTAEVATMLEPVRGKPFFVFHDAYQYFDHRFGLKTAGAIAINPEIMPGAERVRAIRKAVSDAGATCVFAEPQFEPKLISVVTEGTNARSGTLDPLGAAVEPGPDLYFTLIRDMAGAMRDCLSAEG
ncbi:MAG: zinc ABC transporter substrate-binding protein [Rhodobiaceae bacterium]|nr:zinc ABC transporter substrate-binding protein [Rhodobiaceae bacterium]